MARYEVEYYRDGQRIVDSTWPTFPEAQKAALNLRFRLNLGYFDVIIYDTNACTEGK
jgi:hypothetical protein